MSAKKNGRPMHPIWEHFQRGEKRNRFHYHAFCIYCIARFGTDHVPPVRGVSSDMLRHLESCPECPRKVLSSLRELCGQREAIRFDRFLKRKRESELAFRVGDSATAAAATATTTASASSSKSPAAAAVAAASVAALVVTRDHLHAHMQLQPPQEEPSSPASNPTPLPIQLPIPMPASISMSMSSIPSTATTTVPTTLLSTSNTSSKHCSDIIAHEEDSMVHHPALAFPEPEPPVEAKESSPEEEEDLRLGVVKMLITSGIPFGNLRNQQLQALLGLVNPSWTPQVLGSVLEEQFLQRSVQKCAAMQLFRLKNNGINKSGLTLSITCWRNLRLHHLVSFNLIKSSGEAAAVSVQDLGFSPFNAVDLEKCLAQVLEHLKQQHNICVIGIVADGSAALEAARKVASDRHNTLLVVPCIARQLSDLAGLVITHESFATALGDAIELASYFWNHRYRQELQELVEYASDVPVTISFASRLGWLSFAELIDSLLRYESAIKLMAAIGRQQQSATTTTDPPAMMVDDAQDPDGTATSRCPPKQTTWKPSKTFIELVDNVSLWHGLHRLQRHLSPIRETFHLLNQHKQSDAATTTSTTSSSSSTTTTTTTTSTSTAPTSPTFAPSAHREPTLAHVMYQFGRMRQQYHHWLVTTRDVEVVHVMLDAIDTAWRQFEFEPMLLAYAFDFRFAKHVLNVDMCPAQLGWSRVAQIFQETYHHWFDDARLSLQRAQELVGTIGARQFPFDRNTTNQFLDVASFYSFVSDSHGEMSSLCSRLYGISLKSANVARVVRGGVGLVPQHAVTLYDAEMALTLLHVGFASSSRNHLKSMLLEGFQREMEQSEHCDLSSISSTARLSVADNFGFVEHDEYVSSREGWEEIRDDWIDAVCENGLVNNTSQSSPREKPTDMLSAVSASLTLHRSTENGKHRGDEDSVVTLAHLFGSELRSLIGVDEL